MKKYIFNLSFFSLCLFTLLWSCDRKELYTEGEGTVRLNVDIENTIDVVATRALNAEDEARLKEECEIRLYSQNGLIQYYKGVDEIPEEITLRGGDYRVKITAGDSVDVSYHEVFYKKEKNFTVVAGEHTPLEVVGRIVNTVVGVEFDDASLQTVFSEYTVTISSVKGELSFVPEGEHALGYFIVPEDNAILEYTFEGTALSGATYTRSDQMEVKGSTLYEFQFSYTDQGTASGGADLKVKVITTPLEEITDEVEIYQRPFFYGIFEEAMPYYLDVAEARDLEVGIATSSSLKRVILSCERFAEWALPAYMDVMSLKDSEREGLAEKGLTYRLKEANGKSDMRLIFGAALVGKFTAENGWVTITVSATDENGKNRTEDLILTVGGSNVVADQVLPQEVFANRATLRGQIVNTPEERVYFRYRKSGDPQWMEAEVEINGTSFLAQLTGLSPVTTYEYQVAEGESVYAIYTFTTEGAQLPNNSFERWSGSTPLLVHAADEDRFWDTGNQGAATVGGNVTVYDETIFASGNRSIKMQSQFVGVGIFGKFAAGNVFAGKYLKTDGMDGVLGFGREFSDRPVKMRGYIKYNCGIVDYASSTEYHELTKGDPDQGSVYIAVGDWEGEEYNGETFPYIIKTKESERQLFDADVEGTIAYGEKTLYESTTGEGMIPFEIELDYRTWDRKPTAIVIVASASKYGDYFTGSSESCMWLDDLGLVYE